MRKLIPTAIITVTIAVLATVGTVAAQSTQRFEDVPPDHYAFDAIEWAAANGITAGCGDGRFCPDSSLNRAQMVTFLHRYHEFLLGETSDDTTPSGLVTARQFSDQKEELDKAWRAQDRDRLQAAWDRLYELRSGAEPAEWAALVARCETLLERGWMRRCTP